MMLVFRIDKKYSLILSIAITCVCFVLLTVMALTAYDYNRLWFGVQEIDSAPMLVIFTYFELAVAYIAVILLFLLLMEIRRHAVFVAKNVLILRGLSYCCFGEAVLFACEAVAVRWGSAEVMLKDLFFAVLLLLAFACGFVGIILRVLKNALEEGVSMKDENDYTI